jgi:hypothetical protein
MVRIFIFNLNINVNSLGSSQEIQELRNMVAQLSQRLGASDDDNRPKTTKSTKSSLLQTADDNRFKTTERSLSPVLVRNKGRYKHLSPMSRSYKKTLHVRYSFIIKIYLLFNL